MTMIPPKIKGVVRPNEAQKPKKKKASDNPYYPATKGGKNKGGFMGNKGLVR